MTTSCRRASGTRRIAFLQVLLGVGGQPTQANEADGPLRLARPRQPSPRTL